MSEARSPRWVIVDDVDTSRINYYGDSWFADVGSNDNVGIFGPAYRSTLHGTRRNASLSFDFSGTKIGVFGLNNITTNFDVSNPSLNCFVDGKNITVTTPFAQQANNWVFCLNLELFAGPHTLTVNVTVLDNPDNQTFWLDTLQYVPSPTVTTTDVDWHIDENDVALKYDDRWVLLYDRGFAFTNKTGATMDFQFIGTSMTWVGFQYGALPGIASTGTYTIDGGSPTTFTVPGHPDGDTDRAGIRVFKTPNLDNTQHNISITYNGDETVAPLVLDYVYIDNGTYLQIPPDQMATTTAANGADATGGAGSQVSGSKPFNTGALLAGLIPGLVVLILILAVIYIFKVRRREPEGNPPVAPYDIEPTAAYQHPRSNLSLLPRQASSYFISEKSRPIPESEGSTTRPDVTIKSVPGLDDAVLTPLSYASSSSDDGGQSSTREVARPFSLFRTGGLLSASKVTAPPVIYHEDSGLRGEQFPAGETPVVELPPQYTAR